MLSLCRGGIIPPPIKIWKKTKQGGDKQQTVLDKRRKRPTIFEQVILMWGQHWGQQRSANGKELQNVLFLRKCVILLL